MTEGVHVPTIKYVNNDTGYILGELVRKRKRLPSRSIHHLGIYSKIAPEPETSWDLSQRKSYAHYYFGTPTSGPAVFPCHRSRHWVHTG